LILKAEGFRPGFADGLEWRLPSQGLEVLGEVVGCDEGEDVLLQALEVGLVKDLDRRLFDGAVHAFGLTIIRYVTPGAFLVRLFSSEDGSMVSPSGTRGTGSTKVRAGRR
jgi:hypothetical protein